MSIYNRNQNSPNQLKTSEIYLRRRFIAIFISVAVLVLLVAVIFWKLNGNTTKTPVPEINSSAPTASNNPVNENNSANSSAPDINPLSPAPVSPMVPSPGAPSDYCLDNQLGLIVIPDKSTYVAADQPTFTTVITNIGITACNRDIGTGIQKVLVFANNGTVPVWSNTDCSFQPGVDIKLLHPGEQTKFQVSWTKNDSTPQCQAPRKPVPPGTYTAVAILGEKRSNPVAFILK